MSPPSASPLPRVFVVMAVMLFLQSTGAHVLSGGGPRYPFGGHTFAYSPGTIHPADVPRLRLDVDTAAFYKAWKERYLVKGCGPDRYYVFTNAGENAAGIGQESISSSEGHGYGMMITALMAGFDPNARTYFDGLYRFFKDHPSSVSPHLMAWNQVRGCGNLPAGGTDSATDGDLDIAYALILADRQWGSDGTINYLQEAVRVIDAIRDKEINPATSVVLLGGFATRSSPAYYYGTRSSDFMPDHFRAFQTVSHDSVWTRVVDAGYELTRTLQAKFSPTTGLLPDFIQNTNTSPVPARSGYLESTGDGQYSYNACRVPWRLATDYVVSGDPRALQAVELINAWIRRETGENPALIHDGYDLHGARMSSDSSLAFVAPFAVSAMVGAQNQRWLNALWHYVVGTPLDASDYYGNTIKMLSMIVVSGNWWSP